MFQKDNRAWQCSLLTKSVNIDTWYSRVTLHYTYVALNVIYKSEMVNNKVYGIPDSYPIFGLYNNNYIITY